MFPITEKISDKEVRDIYEKLKEAHKKYLAEHGVSMVNLKRGDNYTKSALVLIYFYKHFKEKVPKADLIKFLENMGQPSEDVQQARHLSQQKGWYIISGQRGDLGSADYGLGSGDYALISIQEPYPSYYSTKRSGSISDEDWERIKKDYNFRCATCGSKEGQPNWLFPSEITSLTKGHMDPRKELTHENVIPQCDQCNRPSRNYFVYDKKGKVRKIADPHFITKSSKKVKLDCLEILITNFTDEAKKILKKIESSN